MANGADTGMGKLAWLTSGVARFILILYVFTLIDAAALLLCLVGGLPDEIALTTIAGTGGTILGYAINAAGSRQGADASAGPGSGEAPPAPPAGT